MSPPLHPSEGHLDGHAIKQQFLALFCVAESPHTETEVLDILNFGATKKKKGPIIARPADTIYVSYQVYHQLKEMYDLANLPGIILIIMREKDIAGNTADLGRIFDAIKPHIALFKKSNIGGYILRLMIKNNYFAVEENQSFLRSFFYDLPKDRLRELMHILCERGQNRPKIISTLIELCGYTPEEIDAILE